MARSTSVRLWAISDIHTDLSENMDWVRGLSSEDFQLDALIVAGDVSDCLATLEITLSILVRKFHSVFFTPGNHDLWLSAGDKDSLAKLRRIIKLCDDLGVVTEARKIGAPGQPGGLWVAPLLSWHHQSFDTEPDLQGWEIPAIHDCMTDYRRCRFPTAVSMFDDSAAKAVDALNDDLGRLEGLELRGEGEALMTFSHFLPREDLLLEKRFLTIPNLAKAAGSRFLGERVQKLQPDVHVFGHTHFGWDAVHDNIRYVQAALAYPGERTMRWSSLAVGTLRGKNAVPLVWILRAPSAGAASRFRARELLLEAFSENRRARQGMRAGFLVRIDGSCCEAFVPSDMQLKT